MPADKKLEKDAKPIEASSQKESTPEAQASETTPAIIIARDGKNVTEVFNSIKVETPSASPATSPTSMTDANSTIVSESVDQKKDDESNVSVENMNNDTVVFSNEIEEVILRLKSSGNAVACSLIDELREYIKQMTPGNYQEVESGVRCQMKLFSILKSFVEKVDDDFNLVFSILLAIVNQHSDGVFNPRYVHRFIDSFKLNKDEINLYQELVLLLRIAAPVADRKATVQRNFDFNTCLRSGLSARGYQKIISYFSV